MNIINTVRKAEKCVAAQYTGSKQSILNIIDVLDIKPSHQTTTTVQNTYKIEINPMHSSPYIPEMVAYIGHTFTPIHIPMNHYLVRETNGDMYSVTQEEFSQYYDSRALICPTALECPVM